MKWLLLLFIPLGCLAVWGCFGVTQHLIMALDQWGAAGAQLAQAGQILNRPKWGTLAQVDSVLLNSRLTLDATNKILIHEGHSLDHYDAVADQLGGDIHSLSLHLAGTADALSDTARTASATVASANLALQTARPLIEALATTTQSSGKTLNDLDARIADPRVDALMDHLRGVASSTDGIMGDFRQVADKETKEFLKPTKWYMVPVKRAGEGIDILSAIARNFP
jgi:hypothetical protein